ncbi:MAG TPA: decaprenyl-phosphate phosphoribosyltransferase [Microthrixaceae bacterium]|nr:decaprenyl-phosphate phosphoribosyltransferase [Microthrixaceae bacterium]
MTNQIAVPTQSSLIRGLIRAMRPKQWAKNVLVFVAPGAAGVLTERLPFFYAVFAFVCFSAASAGTYLINDVLDLEADRRHPTKRNRPIAAGIVPVPVALVTAAVLIGAAVTFALWRTWQFGLVVALYVILTTAYSTFLKHRPVLDLVGLAAGFILRLLGGAFAVEVEISDWFLVISCFGALFIATCKRQAERNELGEDAASIRPTLGVYTDQYLGFLKSVSSGAVLIAYCLFAVERAREYSHAGHAAAAVWLELSIVPFVIAILRYALLVDQGKGSAPEELLAEDREMQVIGLLWAVLVGISVYAH